MCENGCGCNTTAAHDISSAATPATASATYTVSGMTCGHCVNSVSGEVGAIPGVTDVTVDLASGTVTLTSDRPVDAAQVKAAVEEAGYELVTSP